MSLDFNLNDVLVRINQVATEKSVKLSYSNSMVYFKLIEWMERQEHKGEDSREVRFYITTAELAEFCSLSPTVITDSLRKLKKCGVINYVTRNPKPSVVTLYKRFWVNDRKE